MSAQRVCMQTAISWRFIELSSSATEVSCVSCWSCSTCRKALIWSDLLGPSKSVGGIPTFGISGEEGHDVVDRDGLTTSCQSYDRLFASTIDDGGVEDSNTTKRCGGVKGAN